jgi:peptidoglycan hydrolase-like protein with peptidoglycan-binding domain
MQPAYLSPGLRLGRGEGNARAPVKALQRDLRRLGYLKTGIDGVFGKGTAAAVTAIRWDLLNNQGRGVDGESPVRVCDFNRGRVTTVDGIFDQGLAAAIAEILADERFAKVPESAHPVAENARIAAELESLPPDGVPGPFLLGILKQESGLKHYSEPTAANEDSFVVVGLDRISSRAPAITSRGYGVGQYTLFHHPPTLEEVRTVIQDPRANVGKAAGKLAEKFARFVNGNTPGTRADDRVEEFGRGPLRRCRYGAADPRYMTDCRECLAAAGVEDVTHEPTHLHPESTYHKVPVRRNIGCDWPYAVRRYNGGGLNSYHYQAQVLLNFGTRNNFGDRLRNR